MPLEAATTRILFERNLHLADAVIKQSIFAWPGLQTEAETIDLNEVSLFHMPLQATTTLTRWERNLHLTDAILKQLVFVSPSLKEKRIAFGEALGLLQCVSISGRFPNHCTP